METIIWISLVILLFIFGIIFFIVELETDEINLFGALSLILIIIGAIIWFNENSPSSIFTIRIFTFISVIIIVIPILLFLFNLFLLYKIKRVSTNPEINEINLTGKEAICIEKISSDKEGHVRYKSEIWRANSKRNVLVGEKVRITGQKGILLYVEPINKGKRYCSRCGNLLGNETNVCTICGAEI